MLQRLLKRMFHRPKLPPMTASEAEVRMKGLRAQLARVKGDLKRLASELQKKPNLSAERKRELRARISALRDEREEATIQLKAMKRVAKKAKKEEKAAK